MNTKVNDIATIASALNGKVDFQNIQFDQILMSEEYRETGVNNIVFVKKAYGVYFYTTKTALENVVFLKQNGNLPVLVGCADSLNLYLIK